MKVQVWLNLHDYGDCTNFLNHKISGITVFLNSTRYERLYTLAEMIYVKNLLSQFKVIFTLLPTSCNPHLHKP